MILKIAYNQWFFVAALCWICLLKANEPIPFTTDGTHFFIMRHALAPGTGDPANFELGDCATQRNLSETGRRQAAAIGKRFKHSELDSAEVFSSQWCRCLETGERLELGEVQELPTLNSFFQRPNLKESQMRDLRKWLAKKDMQTPVILITHQVVITALTGVFPASGEVFLIKKEADGDFSIVDRFQP